MTFAARFKKANQKLAAGSVKTYISTIRRLAKMAGLDETPSDSKWLFKGVLSKVRSLPLGRRKLLSAAGVVAARFYKVEPKGWTKLMETSSKAVEAGRSKQKKTKREKILMPAKGYSEIKKAAAKLRAVLPKESKSLKDLMQVQDAWLLSFFGEHTPRLINDLKVDKGGPNTIEKAGKGYRIVLRQHKTSKSMGKTDIKLDKSLVPLTKQLIADGKRLTKHGNLLSAPRGGTLSKSALSRRLTKITAKTLGRGFSTQILRVLKATSDEPSMKKVRQILNEMGHSLAQHAKYVAK
jgi:hypothetical protein